MAKGSSQTPPAGTGGSVAVVGSQFCFPHPVDLTITKKGFCPSGGDFTVTDAVGDVVFRVKGAFFSFRDRRVLTDPSGNPLISMERKILSNHSRWKVFTGDGSDRSGLLFSAKRSSVFQCKTNLHVFMAANTSEKDCDFKVKGSCFEKSATLFLGGDSSSDNIIAKMKRKHTVKNVLLGKDTFVVTVNPGVDHAFVVALILILHEINNTPAGGGGGGG